LRSFISCAADRTGAEHSTWSLAVQAGRWRERQGASHIMRETEDGFALRRRISRLPEGDVLGTRQSGSGLSDARIEATCQVRRPARDDAALVLARTRRSVAARQALRHLPIFSSAMRRSGLLRAADAARWPRAKSLQIESGFAPSFCWRRIYQKVCNFSGIMP